ncbi:hypothetical protein Tco_1427692 [Tanacetum coccineum]
MMSRCVPRSQLVVNYSEKQPPIQCAKDPEGILLSDICGHSEEYPTFFQAMTAFCKCSCYIPEHLVLKTMSYNEKTGVYSWSIDETMVMDPDPRIDIDVESWKRLTEKGRRRRLMMQTWNEASSLARSAISATQVAWQQLGITIAGTRIWYYLKGTKSKVNVVSSSDNIRSKHPYLYPEKAHLAQAGPNPELMSRRTALGSDSG